ncbi:MAG: DNRLRE domain-containing protein [Dehalococcoidia bacterium]
MKRLFLVVVLLSLFVASCTAIGLGAQGPVEGIVLEAVEDAYVVSDNAVPEDPEGLRDQNFGSLDFVKSWYAWKVIEEEQVVSIGLLKFDLGPVKERELTSAHLQVFALRADLAQVVRLVDVHLVDGQWSEAQVTYNTRPAWGVNPIATSAVYGAGVWYSWDVTGSVVGKAKEGAVSYVVGLRGMEEEKEEQLVFAAREGGRNAPRLMVTYAAPTSIPWYIWAAAIGVAAVFAFLMGWWLARRRRPAAKAISKVVETGDAEMREGEPFQSERQDPARED